MGFCHSLWTVCCGNAEFISHGSIQLDGMSVEAGSAQRFGIQYHWVRVFDKHASYGSFDLVQWWRLLLRVDVREIDCCCRLLDTRGGQGVGYGRKRRTRVQSMTSVCQRFYTDMDWISVVG